MRPFDAFARRFGRLLETGRAVVRHGLRLDTNPVPASWRHVTKVDPEERKKVPIAYPRYLAHTDAVSVGGSADVTDANTERTFDLLDPISTPSFHEPSGATHVTRETISAARFLAVPQVLNGDADAFVGTFGRGIEHVRDEMAPSVLGRLASVPSVSDRLAATLTELLISRAVVEAYIVQNPDSAAARESGVTADDVLDASEAKQRAMAAEYALGAELCYLEYSGTYGGDRAATELAAIADGVDWTRVWYGGGIDTSEKATRMLAAGADAIVVGDAFHRIADEEADLARKYLGTSSTGPGVRQRELDAEGAEAHSTDVLIAAECSDLPPAAEWLDTNVDISETAAACYLSTIPSVDDPTVEARRLLAAALRAYRALAVEATIRHEVNSEAETSGTVADGSQVSNQTPVDVSTVSTVADALGTGVRDREALATEIVRAFLLGDAAGTDGTVNCAFPAEKFAVSAVIHDLYC